MTLPRLSVVAMLAAALTLARAWWITYEPDGLPTWDSAGYLLQAVKLREDLYDLNLTGFLKELTKPDLHPPLHGLLLGLWLLPWEDTLLGARVYAGLAFAVGLVAIAWLDRGRTGGAALLTTLGLGSIALVSTPMTEATTLPVLYGALGLAAHLSERRDRRAFTSIGLAVLVATLVRYNLGPMIAAPVILHRLARGERSPWLAMVVVPTLGLFGAWQLGRPELAENIRRFLENRSSGLDFWSIENLAWVPLTLTADYLGTWLVTLPLLLLFLWNLRRLRDSVDGLLILYVLIAFVLLTLHDFKVSRNLGVVLPAFYLVALRVGAGESGPRPVASVGRTAGTALLLLFAAWQHLTALPRLRGGGDIRPDPVVQQVLETIQRHAEASPRTWVTGWVFRISPNLIDWWLRSHHVPTRLLLDQPSYGERTRTGEGAGWDARYASYVDEVMLKGEATWITLEVTPGTRYYDQWKAYGNNYARAMAEQTRVPEVDRLLLPDHGLKLRVYRAGGVPLPSLPAAAPLPEGALYADTLLDGGATWTFYPPDVVDRLDIRRSPGALSVTIPPGLQKLQLCDIPRPLPATPPPLSAALQVETRGLKGTAWVHLRGMNDLDELQTRDGGAPDITSGGPLPKESTPGASVIVLASPVPSATRLRACLVLDAVSGELTLRSYTLQTPSPDQAAPPALWRPVPPDAPVTITAGEVLTIEVPEAVPKLQVCGPPVAWIGDRMTLTARLDHRLEGRAWLHLRALDAGGVLRRDAAGAGLIEQVGPLTGTGSVDEQRALSFDAETRMVRPCLVLDGTSGVVQLRQVELGGVE